MQPFGPVQRAENSTGVDQVFGVLRVAPHPDDDRLPRCESHDGRLVTVLTVSSLAVQLIRSSKRGAASAGSGCHGAAYATNWWPSTGSAGGSSNVPKRTACTSPSSGSTVNSW